MNPADIADEQRARRSRSVATRPERAAADPDAPKQKHGARKHKRTPKPAALVPCPRCGAMLARDLVAAIRLGAAECSKAVS